MRVNSFSLIPCLMILIVQIFSGGDIMLFGNFGFMLFGPSCWLLRIFWVILGLDLCYLIVVILGFCFTNYVVKILFFVYISCFILASVRNFLYQLDSYICG